TAPKNPGTWCSRFRRSRFRRALSLSRPASSGTRSSSGWRSARCAATSWTPLLTLEREVTESREAAGHDERYGTDACAGTTGRRRDAGPGDEVGRLPAPALVTTCW